MSEFSSLFLIFSCEGVSMKVRFSSLKCLLMLSFVLFVTAEANLPSQISESSTTASTVSSLRGSDHNHNHSKATRGKTNKPQPNIHFSHPDVASMMLAPSQPLNYGSLKTSGDTFSNEPLLPKLSFLRKENADPDSGILSPSHSYHGMFPSSLVEPPLSPSLSDCCKPGTVQKLGSQACHCVYPVRIELLLMNASLSSNWTEFLEELSLQLGLRVSQFEITNFYVVGLSGLNITMDVAPHRGISFAADDVKAMNYSLVMHKVHLDPSIVGDYRLINLTWFESPASPAPSPGISPSPGPRHLPSIAGSFKTGNGWKHANFVLILSIVSGILAIIIIAVMIICKCLSDRSNNNAPAKEAVEKATADLVSVDGSLPHLTSTRFLSYEELKEATKNFEPASVLGEGGFGRVFKGVLGDGTPVAIKKLTSGGHQGDKEFLVEVEMLSRLHHRNLVKLVGYYSSHDSLQHLLCYELVPNGSLEAWLHGSLGANCPLDWDTRMKIALDAARGLAYLHEDSQPCVIHRDFKASNILLENDFHAKVADFGLAKQAPEGRTNYLSTRVMGTFGYVAPEYAMTGHLLVKSDVYSYGVVLLELLTGRKPVDMSQPSGQENLVTWARPLLRDKDRLDELTDAKLAGKYPKEDFVRVCTIAAACVAPEANQRPTMGEVVQSLKMVQRVIEYQDSTVTSSIRPTTRQYESDGTSSLFSSGPFSGLSGFDLDNISRTAVFSEDLHEGR